MILNKTRPDAGAVSVEYVLLLLVGVALAGVLFDLMTGGLVLDRLTSLVESGLERPT